MLILLLIRCARRADQLSRGLRRPRLLSELRGQVVVATSAASWCVACREDHLALVGVVEQYRDAGRRPRRSTTRGGLHLPTLRNFRPLLGEHCIESPASGG